MGFYAAIGSVAMLFMLIVLGVIARKTGLVSEKAQRDVTNVVLYLLLPATIIKAMTRDITPEMIADIKAIVIITFFSYIFIIAISYFLSRRFKLPSMQKDLMFCAMSFSNITFFGLPVQEAVFGMEAVFLTIISQIVFFEFYAWSVGLSILERHKTGAKISFSFKNFIKKPGVAACTAGLILMFLQFKPSGVLKDLIEILSKGTAPLAMITIGFMLANSNIKKAIKNKYLYIASFVKLLVIPLSILFVLYLLGVRGLRMAIPVIELGMPSAAYLAMLAELADNDTTLASEQVMFSSLLAGISIPILVAILSTVM